MLKKSIRKILGSLQSNKQSVEFISFWKRAEAMENYRNKNVIHGPSLTPVIEKRGVGRYIFDLCKKHGDKVCQVDAETGKSETFSSIKKRSIRVAIGLTKNGIKEGDIVSICSNNILDNITAWTAIQFVGATVASLDPSMAPNELNYLINLVKPKILFVQTEFVHNIEKSIESIPEIIDIVVMGSSNKYEEFKKFLKEDVEETKFLPKVIEDVKNERAVILFSSGTTGAHKAICVSHYSLMVEAQIALKEFKLPQVYFHTSTMFWVSAVTMTMMCYITGACRILTQNMDTENVLHIITKYKVNFAFLPSFICHKIVMSSTASKLDFSSMRSLVFAGAGLPEERIEQCRSVMRNDYIFLSYGSTEAGYISSFANEDKSLFLKKAGSSGTIVSATHIKIVDINTGKCLATNQPGEIRAKSPTIMMGFLKLDSSDQFDEEGFLKTGDIGYYDEDHCLYVVGRIKEMFTYQSEVVLPAPIEAVLLKHEAVKEALVYGIPDEIDEFLPAACVVIQDNKIVSEQELLEFVNKKVSNKEQIRGGLKIVNSIPKTPTGKVNRLKFMEGVNKLINK